MHKYNEQLKCLNYTPIYKFLDLWFHSVFGTVVHTGLQNLM